MSRKKRHNKKKPENDSTKPEAESRVAQAEEVEVDSSRAEELSSSVEEASPAGLPSPEAAPDPDGPPDGPPADTAELERLTADAQEMRLLAQRKQAELENYRKRVERESAETIKYAAADLMREILPVLDNLERAINASKSGSEEQLLEGVEIIHKQFRESLTKQGLVEVEAIAAPFDPHVHEAVGRVETSEHPEGTVVEVFQKGYLYKDRLLRPSMVSVSQPAEETPATYDEHVQEDENRVVPQEE